MPVTATGKLRKRFKDFFARKKLHLIRILSDLILLYHILKYCQIKELGKFMKHRKNSNERQKHNTSRTNQGREDHTVIVQIIA